MPVAHGRRVGVYTLATSVATRFVDWQNNQLAVYTRQMNGDLRTLGRDGMNEQSATAPWSAPQRSGIRFDRGRHYRAKIGYVLLATEQTIQGRT